jgi:hypothetical protein
MKVIKEIKSEDLLKEVLELIDFDWRDACSPICAVTHPIKYNPHLMDLRKEIIRLFRRS